MRRSVGCIAALYEASALALTQGCTLQPGCCKLAMRIVSGFMACVQSSAPPQRAVRMV
jgi:hypothetical protein